MNVKYAHKDETVSFDSDMLILVDENDQEIGFKDKLACHEGQGTLHRAFSVFIFNDHGELLLQKRSKQKRLWPLYWSNSCCSHPRLGELMPQAAARRTYEELGLQCPLHYLYKFQYQAQFDQNGAEHELCSVFVGRSNAPVTVNSNEIAEWRFINLKQLNAELTTQPQEFTPWFKLEWRQLIHHYQQQLQHYCNINFSELIHTEDL